MDKGLGESSPNTLLADLRKRMTGLNNDGSARVFSRSTAPSTAELYNYKAYAESLKAGANKTLEQVAQPVESELLSNKVEKTSGKTSEEVKSDNVDSKSKAPSSDSTNLVDTPMPPPPSFVFDGNSKSTNMAGFNTKVDASVTSLGSNSAMGTIVRPVQESETKKTNDSACKDPIMDIKGVNDQNGNINVVPPSFASVVLGKTAVQKVNFRLLESDKPINGSADVQIPISEVIKANSRFENSLYGYFIGKRVAFPVVQQFVLNSWKKFGLTNIMMNSKGFFFFKFNSATGLEGVLENGPWFIRSIPIVLNKWSPKTSLLKEDIKNVPTWVKLYDVPITAYTEVGLSVIASKLGTPLMLDSYTCTMCTSSWGRLDFARAMIDLRADLPLKDTVVVEIPNEDGSEPTLHTVKVEYQWKPPHCESCKVFGHTGGQCPNKVEVQVNPGVNQAANAASKQTQGVKQVPSNPSIKPFRGLVVGKKKKPAVGTKQIYVPKQKSKEASNIPVSNSFGVFNQGASTSSKQKANSGNVQGNNPSLYQKWQGTDGDSEDDVEDDDYDPFDYDALSYLESLDRSRRKKN